MEQSTIALHQGEDEVVLFVAAQYSRVLGAFSLKSRGLEVGGWGCWNGLDWGGREIDGWGDGRVRER